MSNVARVDLCDHCGIFVVHVGPVSLRMESGALDSLAATIAEAQRLVAERAADESQNSPSVTLTGQWARRGRA